MFRFRRNGTCSKPRHALSSTAWPRSCTAREASVQRVCYYRPLILCRPGFAELWPRDGHHLEDGGMLRRKRSISIARIGLRGPPDHDETDDQRKEHSDEYHWPPPMARAA